MDYPSAQNYLYAREAFFSRNNDNYEFHLEPLREWMRVLQNPCEKYPTIHVAGTNGKGSVCHALASIFIQAGYKTGFYTSPHVRTLRERIRVNGMEIPKEKVCDFVERNRAHIDHARPSFFEVMTAMAFDYFAREKVDIAIIETGLGGRLDSTNIITPKCAIITSISLDHTRWLGSDLASIAREKAGIIKPKIPIVVSGGAKECISVFQDIACKNESPLYVANTLFSVLQHDEKTGDMEIMDTKNKQKKVYQVALKGSYQIHNIPCVLQAAEILRKDFSALTPENIALGLQHIARHAPLMGRWDTLATKPKIIIDVAHNEAGFAHAVQQLSRENYRHLHVIIGLSKDKNIDAIITLLPRAASYYCIQSNSERSMPAQVLCERLCAENLCAQTFYKPLNALEYAQKNAHEEDLIFITGSFFFLQDFYGHIKNMQC